MLPQKELLPLTGYVHGGCSPVGMKKLFPTVFHETAASLPVIMVSAGKLGYQIACDPKATVGAGEGRYGGHHHGGMTDAAAFYRRAQ